MTTFLLKWLTTFMSLVIHTWSLTVPSYVWWYPYLWQYSDIYLIQSEQLCLWQFSGQWLQLQHSKRTEKGTVSIQIPFFFSVLLSLITYPVKRNLGDLNEYCSVSFWLNKKISLFISPFCTRNHKTCIVSVQSIKNNKKEFE